MAKATKPAAKAAKRTPAKAVRKPVARAARPVAAETSPFTFGELFRLTNPYTRQRYWATKLSLIATSIVLTIIAMILVQVHPGWMAVQYIVGLVLFWVSFATTIKRLRDANLSLFWALLNLIPFLNMVSFIVFGCVGSSEEKNTKSGSAVVVTVAAAFIVLILFMAMAVGAYLVYNKQHMDEVAPAPAPAPEAQLMTPASEDVAGATYTPDYAPAPEPEVAPEPAPAPMPAPAN